nr:hypothetical protein [Tanacetum cinerariifolium]GEX50188.1 hypothetical protein [Tanacetum cinerariifolium]
MCEMVCQIIQKKQEEKKIKEEQAANAKYWKIPACCDDDDDYNSAITPNEPVDSLSMGDEHLNTISTTESDEFIKSSVENLVPNPSESEGKNGCDVPAGFTTFSNVLFDAEFEFDSVDDQSCSDEDIDSLIDEFSGELTLLKSIPSGIDETDYDPMLPSIEEDDDDSERDILIHEELLDNYSLSLPEKSPDLLSYQGLETFQPFTECPMMIHGKNIPILDVPLFHFYPLDQLNIPRNVKTLAKGFYPPSLHFLNIILGIIYPNLID